MSVFNIVLKACFKRRFSRPPKHMRHSHCFNCKENIVLKSACSKENHYEKAFLVQSKLTFKKALKGNQ